ncbi:uncharacterized protein IAS62_003339 [Cryptococcus decagattii]|uniref:HTH APSES-type domain-containing protein n=1 Tax=Cryptococcus decagattii TaxID=1859122 RepID=A0ABZ2AVY8_9TREE
MSHRTADAPPPYPGMTNDAQYDLTPLPHTANRPRLPEDKRNPHLNNLPEDTKIVKFQTIVRENKEIVVGRIKVPTENANGTHHAFILRRYDTNAISLTTMYKVAFPSATEEEEKREMDWVKSSFDTRGTNGGRDSEVVRLAGQWVSRNLAIHIAPAYNLVQLVAALARAVPDPNVAYRKSQRSQAAADELARTKAKQAQAPSTVPAVSNVPVPKPQPTIPSMTAEVSSPASKRRRKDSVTEAPGISTQTVAEAQPPADTPEADDTRHITIEATTTITSPTGANVDMDAEIEQAKQLVKNLRQEIQLRNEAGDSLEDQGVAVADDVRGVKRGKHEDEAVVISGGAGGKDRVVRTNRRIPQTAGGDVGQRFGWGAFVFSIGLGASLTLFSQYASSLL